MITHPQYQDTCENQDDFKVLIFLTAKQHSRNPQHGPRPKILCMASLQVLQSVSWLVVCFSVGGTGGVLFSAVVPLCHFGRCTQASRKSCNTQERKKNNNSRQHGSFDFPGRGENHFTLIPGNIPENIPEKIPVAAACEDASLVSI